MSVTRPTDFQREWVYSIEKEFTDSRTGEPATWQEGYPKAWGDEFQNLKFEEPINAIDISPDEKLLAIGSGKVVRVFAFSEEKDEFEQVEELKGPVHVVKAVHWSPHFQGQRGYLLLSLSATGGGDQDATLILWSLTPEGRNARPVEAQPPSAEHLTSTALNAVLPQLSPWTSADAEAAGITKGLDETMTNAIAKHSIHSQHTIPRANLSSWSSHPGASPFSPTDPTILAYISGENGPSGNVRPLQPILYSISTRMPTHTLAPATDRLIWQAFSPDGTHPLTASWDGYVRIFSVATGELEYNFGPTGGQLWPGAWSHDSSMIAVPRGSPTTEIYFWDVSADERHMQEKSMLHQQQYVVVNRVQPPSTTTTTTTTNEEKDNVPRPPPHRLISTSHVFAPSGSSGKNIGWSRTMSFSQATPSHPTVLAAGGRLGSLFVIDPLTGEEINSFFLGGPPPATDGKEKTGSSPRDGLRGRWKRFIELGAVRWLEGGRELVWKDGMDGGVELWDHETNRRKRWGMERLRDVEGWASGGSGEDVLVLGDKGEREDGKRKRRLLVSADGDKRVRLWDIDG
ncbi:hypothetical protein MMC28_010651 [Mycoblastus sanguinarius]|nr:hypothetical protein [Mycoblastus sanguinarius]